MISAISLLCESGIDNWSTLIACFVVNSLTHIVKLDLLAMRAQVLEGIRRRSRLACQSVWWWKLITRFLASSQLPLQSYTPVTSIRVTWWLLSKPNSTINISSCIRRPTGKLDSFYVIANATSILGLITHSTTHTPTRIIHLSKYWLQFRVGECHLHSTLLE